MTVQLAQTEQTIEGFGLNTALSGVTPDWATFYGTTGNGLGLSIVRVAMQSDKSLSGAVPPSSYNAKVIASPWTAPAGCKDNGNTQKGGHLITSTTAACNSDLVDGHRHLCPCPQHLRHGGGE